MVKRSYQFRFYPTRQQQKQLAIEFGQLHFVWNREFTRLIRCRMNRSAINHGESPMIQEFGTIGRSNCDYTFNTRENRHDVTVQSTLSLYTLGSKIHGI